MAIPRSRLRRTAHTRWLPAAGIAWATIASASTGGFVDVTEASFPGADLNGRSMHAIGADIDHDGDLDIVVAREFETNLILINDGSGRFTDLSAERLPSAAHDSEEVVFADFDGDGFGDLLFVSEDDEVHELYFNDGSGRFADHSDGIPIASTANGVAVIDVNLDGHPDVVLANNGQNVILVNDGTGTFRDETPMRLPVLDDVSQDVESGDVNGDGFVDLVFANEGRNVVLLNDGSGIFADHGGLPEGRITESRMVSLADIDGDGDLDLFFANVALFVRGVDPQNQIFVNDGDGNFTEETADRLPPDRDSSFEGKFVDVDSDGDADLVIGNANALGGPGNAPARIYINESGVFTPNDALLPPSAIGNVFSVASGDFNGDGRTDIYLALRYGHDRLLVAD